MATYVVDLTPEGKTRRKVRVSAGSESEASHKAIQKAYGRQSGTRKFQVHNITRVSG